MPAVAYGANIGGCLSLIGTAQNAIFAWFVREECGCKAGFAQWMLFAGPRMLRAGIRAGPAMPGLLALAATTPGRMIFAAG